MKDLQVRTLALVLSAIGLSLCLYKTTALGLPLSPTEKTEVWTVEARLSFKGKNTPAKVEFYIPRNPPGFALLGEDFVSSNYGSSTEDNGENRVSMWAVRKASGQQVLYYRALLHQESEPPAAWTAPQPPYPDKPDYPEPYKSAVNSLLEAVRGHSADIASFTRELIKTLNGVGGDESVQLIRGTTESKDEFVAKIVDILAGARIPARIVYGLKLSDGVREASLQPWLEVHDENQWMAFDPMTGKLGYPAHFLVWRVGNDPLVRVKGGEPAVVDFSIASDIRAVVSVAETRARLKGSRILEYSLFGLPIGTQNVYKILLTIPLGAFLVVFMRNVIGFHTFGTFMPVLIALAFRETQLVSGLVLFSLIVALGLSIRFYFETLHLLAVPRVAAVLIIVVILMAAVTLLTHKLGFQGGLSVALFPMVVLAMTIERMSVVWEENGARDALQQGAGSLVVASLAYVLMSTKQLTYLLFVFPELLLVVLAATLLLGRYTGYRLSEFWRFRAVLFADRRLR